MGKKSIWIPYEAQINNWYCGPATIRMISLALGYGSRGWTQSVIGNSIGANSSHGTDNNQLLQGVQWYASGRYRLTNTSTEGILSGAMASIDMGLPVAANVSGRVLDPKLSNVYGHYVVVSGYDGYAWGNSGHSNLTYVDAWLGRIGWSFAPRTVSASQTTNALNSQYGWYVRGYY